MLRILGHIIEKKPWVILVAIVLVTLFLSSFISGLEFKTDFNDFTPDEPLVQANTRILEYFGESQQLILMRGEVMDEPSVLTIKSLRELHAMQQKHRFQIFDH